MISDPFPTGDTGSTDNEVVLQAIRQMEATILLEHKITHEILDQLQLQIEILLDRLPQTSGE